MVQLHRPLSPGLPARRQGLPRPLAGNGLAYLRCALIEATLHACRHPAYSAHYEHTKRRLGRQRGTKVARIEIARRLAEAIWYMLTRNQPFAPAGPVRPLVA